MSSLFEIPIENLNNIGTKRAECFRKLGVKSVGELIRFYPRGYDDWSKPVPISEIEFGKPCCVKGIVCDIFPESRVKEGRTVFKFRINDGISYMNIVYFNNPYIKNKIKADTEYLFLGRATSNYGGITMVAPQVEAVDLKNKIMPIYHQSGVLSSKNIMNAVQKALNMLPSVIKDIIPKDIREKYNLCELKFALKNIHFPKDMLSLKQARERLIFEELLVMQLGMGGLKSHRASSNISINKDYSEEFYSLLPFTLTNAQKRTVSECINDLKNTKNEAMNRLVQGDVGSGKTAVAACVCYSTVKSGYQCAFMVPTEILAEQHYSSLCSIFGDKINIALLTGSTKTKERKNIIQSLADGKTDIVIGTHALISDGVDFNKLGLVVTDEQHRFGVAQRAKLLTKGENPHLLVMSATPIPRTLALVVFGDLDVSIIDELPPGRKKINTYLIDSSIRERALGFVKKELDKGRQAYVVCPLVEQSESELQSAEEYAVSLQAKLKEYSVAVLHGKMKSKEKEKIMSAFSCGEIQVLVSTTVIEVGVDVPNSTIMMIENAERFGLSQLHQLRGRVGRGKYESYCILISDIRSKDTKARLQVMCLTNNGFEIAEHDLRLRGPGDFFGSAQHGLINLKIASLDISDSLEYAQLSAREILSSDPILKLPQHRGLRAEIKRIFGSVSSQWLN